MDHEVAFPEGLNVNVATIVEGVIGLRTWKRGAGLTLACGTGACATAVAAIRSNGPPSPVRVTMPGGALTISWERGEPIRMRGSATHVFSGELEIEPL